MVEKEYKETMKDTMTAEMRDTTYNGWSNYPTWCVNLWLSNDEGLYAEACERAQYQRGVAPGDEMVGRGIWSINECERYRLAEDLKDWVSDELAPDLGATFAADLLGYALGEVDWSEIAESWLEGLES